MEKALEGIRVLDMTHVQSGPACTQILAWFGADVIKIERPGEGDPTRSQLRDIPDVDSLYFTMLNSNKRSITLNPKTAAGNEIFRKLIEKCDVLVENFAPGALDRMGFSWEKIQEINPRIIYASIKGFGPGPYEECKVYENVAQCTGGAASTTGAPHGTPLVTGAQIGDSGCAVAAREDRPWPASRMRNARCCPEPLPREVEGPTTARPGTPSGVSAISQRRFRQGSATRPQCLGRRTSRLGPALQRLGGRSRRLRLRHRAGAGVFLAGQGYRPRRLASRS